MITSIVNKIANKVSNKREVYNIDKEVLNKVLTYDYAKDIKENNHYLESPLATPYNVMVLLLETLSAINIANYPFYIEYMEQENLAYDRAIKSAKAKIKFSMNDYATLMENTILQEHTIVYRQEERWRKKYGKDKYSG